MLPALLSGPVVVVIPHVTVAADHPAQIAATVVSGRLRGLCKRTDAHELVVDSEVRAPRCALLGAGYVFPAAGGGQEPVVGAADQAGAVRERYSVGGFHG